MGEMLKLNRCNRLLEASEVLLLTLTNGKMRCTKLGIVIYVYYYLDFFIPYFVA